MNVEDEVCDAASLLKVLGHPIRLCIVRNLWRRGSCNVSHMQECLGSPQSTVSQQLAKLSAAGIIKGTRNGLEIKYEMVSEEVARILSALFPDKEGKQ